MCIVQENIDDEAVADVILSSDMGKQGHFHDGISLEIGDEIEKKDIFNDWMSLFCENNVDDELDGYVCHLLVIGEDWLGMFFVSIFDCGDGTQNLCTSWFLWSIQIKSIQMKYSKDSNDHISKLKNDEKGLERDAKLILDQVLTASDIMLSTCWQNNTALND